MTGAERHDVVGSPQRVCVTQIDLLLTGRALVVAELDGDAHRLQHVDRRVGESPDPLTCGVWSK